MKGMRRAAVMVAVAATVISAGLTFAQAAERSGNPTGFQPEAASFVSPAAGFVLGTESCPPGHACRVHLIATADAGVRWRPVAAPDVKLGGGGRAVLFASRDVGWLYGPGLWVTRDGALHWRRLAAPGAVLAMTVASGHAYAIVEPARGISSELFSSPIGANRWRRVGHMTGNAEAVLAASGRRAWFGSVTGPTATVWQVTAGTQVRKFRFACAGTSYGLTSIAAATPSRVAFLCTNTADFNTASEGIEVMLSVNGGRTERLTGRKAPVIGDGGVLAAPPGSGTVLTFATSVGNPTWIGRSADDGKTWKQVADFSSSGGSPFSLSYVTRLVGFIVIGGSRLLRTTDAGRTWHQIRI
jgi:photosystem II stability/assembly factor-like uncharacterized protein